LGGTHSRLVAIVYLLVRAWWESVLYSCLGASFLAAPFSTRLALLGWSGFPLLSFHVLMLWSRAAFVLAPVWVWWLPHRGGELGSYDV
jgi:hypothetical protein